MLTQDEIELLDKTLGYCKATAEWLLDYNNPLGVTSHTARNALRSDLEYIVRSLDIIEHLESRSRKGSEQDS